MNRRELLAAALAGASAPLFAFGARGDEVGAKRRLCVLTFGIPEWGTEHGPVLRKALLPFGFTEDNLEIPFCSADALGASLDQCAAKLVRSGCDALFTQGTNQTRALRRATSTIPIVTALGDPVGSGFAATLARPGGNVTGLSFATVEAVPKLLEYARLMVSLSPGIAFLGHAADQVAREASKRLENAMRPQGVAVRFVPAESPADAEREFQLMRKRGERIAVAYQYHLGPGPQESIAESAVRNRIALVTYWKDWVQAGALLSYQTRFRNFLERQAMVMARVLRGAKPGDTPFELPDTIELVVNRTTASRLGIEVPNEILILATEVIGS